MKTENQKRIDNLIRLYKNNMIVVKEKEELLELLIKEYKSNLRKK